MTDEQLSAFAWPDATSEQAAALIVSLTPERRATFERMAFVADELNAGRLPAGVLIDR